MARPKHLENPAMKASSLREREEDMLASLAEGAQSRAQAEVEAEAGVRSRAQAADKRLADSRHTLTNAYQTEKATLQREYDESRNRLKSRFEAQREEAERDYSTTLERLESQFATIQDEAKTERRDTRWMAATVYETSRKEADKQLDERRWQIKEGIQKLREIWEEAVGLLLQWRQYRPRETPQASVSLDSALDDYPAEFEKAITHSESRLAELKQLRIPSLFRGFRPVWIVVALFTILVAVGFSLFPSPMGLLVASSAAVIACSAAVAGLYFYAKSVTLRVETDLRQALADAEEIGNQFLEAANRLHQAAKAKLKAQRHKDQQKADARCLQAIREAKQSRDQKIRTVRERYPRQVDEIEKAYRSGFAGVQGRYPPLLEALEARYRNDLARSEADYEETLQASNARYEEQWQTIVTDWRRAVADAQSTSEAVNHACRNLFLPWKDLAWGERPPCETAPPVIPVGQVELSMKVLPQGFPAHPRLEKLTPEAFTLPALLPFPGRRPVLLTTDATGYSQAIETLHALMLRLITSLPAGKARFQIVDPVGSGQNFAAFMRLADYDEAMVSKRIWTEPEQIERRLADLTEHMENVIQKYLRNEFKNLEAYNVHAGEVAEAYRFLVIADYPVNFNDEAVRRLERIMSNGPRCGVHTLMLINTSRSFDKGIELDELTRQSEHFAWSDGRFRWKSSPFERFPLHLDVPPETGDFIRILEHAGQAARDAKRVEVPFDVVLPATDQRWASDSRDRIRVPLGRAGATRLQYLELGKGTLQHVLVAGKTGSGKSTLLNVLVTSLAFHYSPQQVELYLVDFKKGVEFKAYATHQLPHARVVAVESDREFGLSVLERLDGEIQRRGEAFRQLGVQDLAAFREAKPGQSLPRVLLIVDEFQEFFVEDDRIAQDASLLLDRLVRQGRAFGIHVLLGSQTISGAYSLARSTLSQMAVRIALECSETDAHLILNEDNTAAAMLARPGEAVYNDAGGLVDGNSPFQTAWLPDNARERHLEEIRELARREAFVPPEPPVVFEGNRPADISGNLPLVALLQGDRAASIVRDERRAWLGEAVAIKGPTSVVFSRQGGSNLLLVGQQAEGALSILSTAVVSLAAGEVARREENAAGLRFVFLDGGGSDSRASQYLAKVSEAVDAPTEIDGPPELTRVLSELATEVENRQHQGDEKASDVFLLIYDAGRFRELRRSDDDLFASSLDDEVAKPPDLLATIVRDGPSVGVHTLVWCDSLSNLNRTLDRGSRREFDATVLFQMGADDSSSLIDSPQANKLGPHRALFFSEEQGELEKFRPYALPPGDWLAWVRQCVQTRSERAAETP